jgi:hypothetical protein
MRKNGVQHAIAVPDIDIDPQSMLRKNASYMKQKAEQKKRETNNWN